MASAASLPAAPPSPGPVPDLLLSDLTARVTRAFFAKAAAAGLGGLEVRCDAESIVAPAADRGWEDEGVELTMIVLGTAQQRPLVERLLAVLRRETPGIPLHTSFLAAR